LREQVFVAFCGTTSFDYVVVGKQINYSKGTIETVASMGLLKHLVNGYFYKNQQIGIH
jgi:hypothetical protein